MTIRFIGALLCGGLLLLVRSAALAAATPTAGACKPTSVRYLAAADFIVSSTTSGTFVDVPQARVTFIQGGASASCVIVRFSAGTYATGVNEGIILRAYLDNTTAALPSALQFSGDDTTKIRVHSFDFIFPSIT